VWLRQRLHTSPATAQRLVRLAAALDSSPALDAAVCEGSVSAEQAQAIASAVADLPAEAGSETIGKAETLLMSWADQFDPITLTKLGTRILAHVDPEAADQRDAAILARQEQRAYRKRGFTLSPIGDGRVRLTGWLDSTAAATVNAALDPLCHPRRDVALGIDQSRSPAQRRADALVDICALALRTATLPTTAGEPTQVVVTIPVDTLSAHSGGTAHKASAPSPSDPPSPTDTISGAGQPAPTPRPPQANPDPTSPGATNPDPTSPDPTSPDPTSPGALRPAGARPRSAAARPNTSRPGTSRPGTTRPGVTRPSTVPPSTVPPSTVPPSTIGPSTIRPTVTSRAPASARSPGNRGTTGAAQSATSREPTAPARPAGDARCGWLDNGTPISPAEARRLACDAQILPAVLGTAGQVLDVGRARRLFTGAIRRALILRDGGCSFPGCDRPATWCEGHHITAWADGGVTALANACLLCRHHHRLIHQTDWQVRLDADGNPEFLPPTTVDPLRRPRRNVFHRRQ
jgi:hypothetical protein